MSCGVKAMSRKVLDEKGRLFGVIKIVDVIVIILAIVLICGIYVKFGRNERTGAVSSGSMQTVTYQMEIKSVRSGITDNLRAGDKIYDQENDVELGTITDVQVTDARRSEALIDGTVVEGTVQGRYDVILTIEGSCQVIGGRYYINRSDEISVNSDKQSYTKYCEFTGTVVGIEQPEQAAE